MPNHHPLIPDAEIPAPLRRPLRFGDPEQIEALRYLDRRIQEMTAIAEENGVDVRLYAVTVTAEGEVTVTVLATDAAAARAKVEESFDIDDIDLDVHYLARQVSTHQPGR